VVKIKKCGELKIKEICEDQKMRKIKNYRNKSVVAQDLLFRKVSIKTGWWNIPVKKKWRNYND